MTEMSTEFGSRKTVIILTVVAGCFAMLGPKILYPMLTASIYPPHSTDNSRCCDVIFESDVTAVDIMQELCHNIIRHHQIDPQIRDAIAVNKLNKLVPASKSLCREEVLARCGIDLSSFLAEKERLKKSYKQVLEEIRGFNGSLCLKMQFGVPLARIGTPHHIRYHILMPHSTIRQERQTPPHAGSYHPALRERGRAIPSSYAMPKVQDRPDHIPPIKMRPPMGGAGHVVAAPKGNGSLGLLMPLYTIGIIIFFLYTISKVLIGIIMPLYTIGNFVSILYKVLQVLRKSTDSEIIRPEYSSSVAEREYQKLVFNPEVFAAAVTAVNGTPCEKNERAHTSMNESSPTIEELKEHQAPKSNGLSAGINLNSKESTSPNEIIDQEDEKELEEFYETTPTVKVLNMEMTASCEGGQKCSRPTTPILIAPHDCRDEKEKSPPISIYLEGALPPQCELLVTDSKTQEIQEEENTEVPVVLSGKMTLSLISLDQESQETNAETEAASRLQSTEKNFKNECDESDQGNKKNNLHNKKTEAVNQKTTEAPKKKTTETPNKKTTETPNKKTTETPNKKTTETPNKKTIYGEKERSEIMDLCNEIMEGKYDSESEDDDDDFDTQKDVMQFRKIAQQDYDSLISKYDYKNIENLMQTYDDEDYSAGYICENCKENPANIPKNPSYKIESEENLTTSINVGEDKAEDEQDEEEEEDQEDDDEDWEDQEDEEEQNDKRVEDKNSKQVVKVSEEKKEFEDEEYEQEYLEDEDDQQYAEDEDDDGEYAEDEVEEDEYDEDNDEAEEEDGSDNSENEENQDSTEKKFTVVKNRN